MSFYFDASDFHRKVSRMIPAVRTAAQVAVQKSVDDLERISTNIVPIETGQLRIGATKSVKQTALGVTGEVGFHAVESSKKYGRFNYAIWTHEMSYSLGPKSQQVGGTDGYPVGNKYLTRPLKGEAMKYFGWWALAVQRAINR